MDWIDLFTTDPAHDLYLTTAIVVLLVVVPMAYEIQARRFDIWKLKTLFLVFILLQFGVWPLLMYIPRTEQLFTFTLSFYTSRYSEFITGQYCAIAGLLAFYVGYYRRPLEYGEVGRHRWFERSPGITDRSYRLLFWGCTTVTALAFGAMMASTGGLLYFVQNIDTLRSTSAAGWGVYLLPFQACQVGFTLCTAQALERRSSLVLPIVGTVLQLVFAFVIGERILLIAPLASLVIGYHLHVRRIRVTWRTIGGILAFLAFNTWYVVFRGSGDVSLDALGKIPFEVFLFALLGRFHGGESLARIIDHTNHTGFHFGLPYVQDFLVQFLPRFLFPGKEAIAVTENVTFFPEAFSGKETGSAVPSLMGELYWAFGIVAIVVGLYLHGRVFRRVEEDLVKRSPVQTTIYWAFFLYALFVNETITYHLWALSFRLLVLAGLIAWLRTKRAESPAETPFMNPPDVTGTLA